MTESSASSPDGSSHEIVTSVASSSSAADRRSLIEMSFASNMYRSLPLLAFVACPSRR